MQIPYSFTKAEGGTQSVVFFGSQGPRLVPDTHANFAQILNGLASESLTFDEAYALADAATTVISKLTALSERVAVRGDTIYFDGDEMENRLTKHIVDMIKAGDDNLAGYVAFLENVQANPTKTGRKGFFRFIERNGLTITEDGCAIAYKGVRDDGRSLRAGREDVTVTLEDGTTDVHKGNIPNPVGATISMARSLVDPDRSTACSVGLHVGTHEFALEYGSNGHFLTVKVNPRDVVETPNDSNGQKVRVCRYTVLEDNVDRTRYEGTSFVENDESSLEDDDLCPDCGEILGGETSCYACGYGAEYEDDYAEDEDDHGTFVLSTFAAPHTGSDDMAQPSL